MACERYTGEDGKRHGRSRYLHIEIMNPEHNPEIYVDHEGHNTLNNLESNLRCTKNNKNLQHRGDKNKNNKTGYRNVSEIEGLFCVQLQEGKNTMLGKFGDVHQAGIFAEEMREKYYGEYKGNN